jgi:hypothetical protein
MFQPFRRNTAKTNKPCLEALEDRCVPTVIAGYVYADLNHNGIMDPGETPIANSLIQLHNSANAIIGSSVTDANGHYQFSVDQSISTAPASESFSANLPAARTNHARTASVSQFDPSLGTLTSVDIINNGSLFTNVVVENLDPDAEHVSAQVNGNLTLQGPNGLLLTSSPSGSYAADLPAFDGQADLSGPSSKDFGVQEIKAQTQSVTLHAGTSDLSAFVGTGAVSLTENATATSTANGAGNLLAMIRTTASSNVKVVYHYIPANAIKPGFYVITQVNEPAGYLDGLETWDNIKPIPGTDRSDFIPVTVSNQNSLTNNFGEIPPAQVGGVVYYDRLNLGRWGAGNVPLGGVKVTLTGTTAFGRPVQLTQQTGPDGSYLFTGLMPGDYRLTETQPAGYSQGVNTVGNLGGSVSGDQFTLSLPTGGQGTNYNFGEVLPSQPVQVPETLPPPVVNPPMTGLLPPSKIYLIGGNWGAWGW